MRRVLVTGGSGFIGSSLCRHLVLNNGYDVCNIDKLTYAGIRESLRSIENNPKYQFFKVDICKGEDVKEIIRNFKPDIIMHLAAESHVDRSIDNSSNFINTNIFGTYTLLECARSYWETLNYLEKDNFRFHHVSTDEVYGSLGKNDLFTEETPYSPRSPYSSSKASSDHLVRAWFHTYGLPIVISNCSNNYGPYQFPEKLIPLMILNALEGKSLPIYGKGDNIRDWLYIEDHVQALITVAEKGVNGQTYNIGGRNEFTNLDIVKLLCKNLDIIKPKRNSYVDQIIFVDDRPGHDFRYAIDPSKIEKELGWKATENFDSGILKTISWYLENEWWWKPLIKRN